MGKMRRLALTFCLCACIVAAWGVPAASSGRLDAAQPTRFRFAILGDRTGGAVAGVYEAVWREVDQFRPDFVINVGDSIQGGNDNRVDSEWRGLKTLFARYSYPLYLVPGNHDIWSDASRRAWQKQTGRPPFYSFDYRQAHFVVLDNSRTNEPGQDQLKFLEEDLKANRARSPKFVFLHKPFWIMHVLLRSGGFPLHQLAKQYGVDYVFSGHVHKFARFELDGVRYTMVGSSGAMLGHGDLRGEDFADGWFYHHLRVEVEGPGARVTVKELGPPRGQGRSFRLEDWGK